MEAAPGAVTTAAASQERKYNHENVDVRAMRNEQAATAIPSSSAGGRGIIDDVRHGTGPHGRRSRTTYLDRAERGPRKTTELRRGGESLRQQATSPGDDIRRMAG